MFNTPYWTGIILCLVQSFYRKTAVHLASMDVSIMDKRLKTVPHSLIQQMLTAHTVCVRSAHVIICFFGVLLHVCEIYSSSMTNYAKIKSDWLWWLYEKMFRDILKWRYDCFLFQHGNILCGLSNYCNKSMDCFNGVQKSDHCGCQSCQLDCILDVSSQKCKWA